MSDSLRNQLRQNAGALAVIAWLVPGAGYFLLRDRFRAWLVTISLAVCFWLGVAIGGAPHVIVRESPYLWYLAQMFAGGHLLLGEALKLMFPREPTGGESVDLGIVFTGVCGLLNLLVVLDVLVRAFPGAATTSEPARDKPAGANTNEKSAP